MALPEGLLFVVVYINLVSSWPHCADELPGLVRLTLHLPRPGDKIYSSADMSLTGIKR